MIKEIIEKKDCCPYCGQEAETIIGLRYPCGTFYKWRGVSQSEECKRVCIVVKEALRVEDKG